MNVFGIKGVQALDFGEFYARVGGRFARDHNLRGNGVTGLGPARATACGLVSVRTGDKAYGRKSGEWYGKPFVHFGKIQKIAESVHGLALLLRLGRDAVRSGGGVVHLI